jgi:ArsR family transcriptional regulator
MQRSNSTINLSADEEHLINVMSLLGDETRFRIFKILQSGNEMCVSEIAAALGVSVPAVSQHFKIFELTGLVDKQRYGQKICYQLKADDPIINNIISN